MAAGAGATGLAAERAAAAAAPAARGLTPHDVAVALYGSPAVVAARQRLAHLWFHDALPRSGAGTVLAAALLPRPAVVARAARVARALQELRAAAALDAVEWELLQEVAFEEGGMAVHETVYRPAVRALAGAHQRELAAAAAS